MGTTPKDDQKKVFNLKSADGKTIPIPAGEYYVNTKARCRKLMKEPLSSEAQRVYACLELATMGFRQELAVILEGRDPLPLRPIDIARQTGLSRQNVRRGLEELEIAGLAERRPANGGSLRKGQVLIYSWAIPRETRKQDCSARDYNPRFPGWFPDSWEPLKSLINRYKYSVIDDEESARDYIEEITEAARDYQRAEIVALRALERVCARQNGSPVSLLIKESKDIGERPSSSSSVNGTTTTTPPSTEDFHEQHVAVWEAAGKDGVPTPKQSAQAAAKLRNRQQDFLRWLTPQKLKRVQHPGALPKLIAEFLQIKSIPPPDVVPKCWKCGGSIENGSVDGVCFDCALASQKTGAPT